MKVILYYPALTEETTFPTWEPLQLLFLARMLKSAAFDVEIIDGRITTKDEFERRLITLGEEDVVCFGVTALTCYQIIDAVKIARSVKAAHPDLPIVFGGWHSTIFSDEIITFDEVDIVVKGQGEYAFLELVQKLEEGKTPAGIRGVLWKDHTGIVKEEQRFIESVDELPRLKHEDFEILDLQFYQCRDILFYMSSAGCPYSCTYCCIGAAARKSWVPLSADNVLGELEDLHRAFGFKEVIFWDNVFFVNKERVEAICRGLIERGFGIQWSAHGRINEIVRWDDDFLQLLKDSGCKSIFVGVESGSQRILDRLKKGIKEKDVLPAFARLKHFGIDVAANFMVGLPGERVSDVRKTMTTIRKGLELYDNDLSRFQVFVYRFVAFPGTSIFDELPQECIRDMPADSIEWGKFIHYKINDGMQPWEEDNDASLFASSTFYLWKAYLNQYPPIGLKAKILKALSKFRVKSGFYRLPLEWYVWKWLG